MVRTTKIRTSHHDSARQQLFSSLSFTFPFNPLRTAYSSGYEASGEIVLLPLRRCWGAYLFGRKKKATMRMKTPQLFHQTAAYQSITGKRHRKLSLLRHRSSRFDRLYWLHEVLKDWPAAWTQAEYTHICLFLFDLSLVFPLLTISQQRLDIIIPLFCYLHFCFAQYFVGRAGGECVHAINPDTQATAFSLFLCSFQFFHDHSALWNFVYV